MRKLWRKFIDWLNEPVDERDTRPCLATPALGREEAPQKDTSPSKYWLEPIPVKDDRFSSLNQAKLRIEHLERLLESLKTKKARKEKPLPLRLRARTDKEVLEYLDKEFARIDKHEHTRNKRNTPTDRRQTPRQSKRLHRQHSL